MVVGVVVRAPVLCVRVLLLMLMVLPCSSSSSTTPATGQRHNQARSPMITRRKHRRGRGPQELLP